MNMPTLKSAVYTAMFALAAWAPASIAIVKDQKVQDAFDSSVPAVTVDFTDLDLDRGAGVEILYNRLRSAAHAVCRAGDGRNITAAQEARKCFDQAMDRALNNVGNERLNALHEG